MKYILLYDKGIGKECIPFLENEITRNDVRAKIQSIEGKATKRLIKEINPDLILLVGMASVRGLRNMGKSRIKVCSLLLDLDLPRNLKSLKFHDLVFSTFPSQYHDLKQKQLNVEYVGSPYIDLLRQHDFSQEISVDSNKQNVLILPDWNKTKPAHRLKSKLEKTTSNVQFILPEERGTTLDLLKHSNVVIVLTFEGSLQALLSNCPQIFIGKNRSANQLSNKSILKEFKMDLSQIVEEINLLLNDHQYSATMLQNYQEVRQEIGMEPSFRKIGHLVGELLEGKS